MDITRFDPSLLIILASVLGTFLTVLAFLLPYIRPDPLAARLRSVTRRRQELKLHHQESGPRSRLRRARPMQPRLVAATAALGAAGLSAALLQFFHPFAITWLDLGVHLAAVGLLVGLGGLAARVLDGAR